jgi:tetratricopeptide (TPR) repeat protein
MSSGKIALNQGRYDEAIRHFSVAIEEKAGNAQAYYWRGIAYARKKQWQEYATDTENAFSLHGKLIEKAKKEQDTDNHSIYFFYSARQNFFENKDYELALGRAETSIQFNPKNVFSLNLKALCLAELKRDAEAEEAFLQSIETKPNLIDSYIYLAGFYKSKIAYEKEEETLRKAKKIVDNPDWFGTVDEDSLKIKKADAANVYHSLGVNLFNQQKLREAEKLLEKAHQFDPQDRDIIYDLGMVFVQQESWHEAADAFDRVIEIDRDDAHGHYYLGFSFLMLIQYRKAIELFTKVIDLDPEWCDAYFKRAMCYRELGNSAAAYNDVKRGKECEERDNEK